MSKPIEALSPTDAAALEDALAGMLDDRYATSAQGAKADTAVQPGALGTAAGQSASAFASAEQGVKADRADGARQTMARRIGLRSKIVGWAVPFYRVLADGSRLIIGGQRDDGVFYAPKGILADPAPSNPRRGSWGIFHIFDRNRVSAFSVMPDRKIRMAAGLEATTLSVVMGQIDAAGGAAKARLINNLPGYNHRPSTKAAHIAATMPTWLGPVDVDMPVSGIGNAVAITNLPYVVLSFSGQSNTLAGSKDEGTTGDVITQNDVDFGLHLRGIRDPHRAFRGPIRRYSSSAPGGVAPYYTAGSITDMQPSGQDAEVFGIYTWLPDLVQYSIIHLDQMMAQSQAVYLQMTSAQGSTPITDYLPGQTRGDNITGFITGAQDMIASKYGKKAIGPAHFMVGHEDAAIAPYASYYDALGAMADHVCGKLNALQGNVDAGLSAKLITYQANQSRGTPDGKTFASGGTLDTLTRSFADIRIANIGGVYDELTADGGIHMRGKFSTALKMAYAFVMWWRFGVRVQAPYIARAIWDGNVTVTCTVEGMAGPLMEDTDWLPVIADGGLFYDDDDPAAPPAITGVKIVNTMDSTTSAITRQIVITLASAPTGVLKSLYIGGRNNNALTDWSGGLTSFYVPGIPNFWYDKGFGKFCTPDLRWRLCPAIAMVRRAGFDFSQLVMPAGATLTRGSTGWYRNNAGAVTAAAANAPRFNYRWTGSAWALAGLLNEGEATNSFLYSQDASNPAWSKASLTTPSVDTLIEDTATTTRYIRQNYNFVSGTPFCTSVVASELGGSAKRYLMLTARLEPFGGVGNALAKFDLATGSVVYQSAEITAGIELVGPGKWRCWITGTPTVTVTTNSSVSLHSATSSATTYTGDGVSGIKVEHMQIEAGTKPSSIIPTGAAAVTRAADVLALDWAAGAGLADGAITARYTSGDATVQDVATSIVGGNATVPTNLNRRSVLLVEML